MAEKKRLAAPSSTELKKLRVKATKTDTCSKACLILKHAHESSQALLTAYRLARMVRSFSKGQDGRIPKFSMRGMSTDEEQDLLRAMLVTAASGLDAMTKQLVRDALPNLIKTDSAALSGLEKFVRRKIKGEVEEEISDAGAFLARILVAPSIQKQVIEDYIAYLTKGSLQSSDELSKVVDALALTRHVKIDHKTLRPIFEIRNKIIHELDINLDADRRNRNIRSEEKMKVYTNSLIDLGQNILIALDKKLSESA